MHFPGARRPVRIRATIHPPTLGAKRPAIRSAGAPCRRKETRRPMMMHPRTVERLLSYMSKIVWLIIAYSFGTMVGRLILLAS